MTHSDPTWLDDCLRRFSTARVAVVGDLCLDAYLFIDPTNRSDRSRPALPVRRVRRQRYSLGGAGNVLANLAALGVGYLRAIGLVGDDLFGRELRRLMDELNVDATGGIVAGACYRLADGGLYETCCVS